MKKSTNLLIFFLFAVSSAHFVNCRPVKLEPGSEVLDAVKGKYVMHLPVDRQRVERQVVQPKWLSDENHPLGPNYGKVVITEQNLEETAELRDAIQKAVEEGRYYAELDETDFSNENAVPTSQRSVSTQSRQFAPSPSTPWNPAQWSMSFQQQQPQLFNPSSWNAPQWSMSFQPQAQRGGAAQLTPWNPAQWAVPFQQQQQQQMQFFVPSPFNQNQQWSMQFGWPTMGPQQPNPMERMWNDFMQNTRRMFDPQ